MSRIVGCICDASSLRIYSTMACEALEVLARVAPAEKDRILRNANGHAQRIKREREKCPNHAYLYLAAKGEL